MKTILIVDDEVDIAETLQILLGLYGYRVIVAFDGRDAFEKAVSQRPDLVLTDLMMPIMNGHELIARLREHPATSRIPILAMSASHEAERADVLRKPFDIEQLVARLRRALKER